jgi:hypothetical protein
MSDTYPSHHRLSSGLVRLSIGRRSGRRDTGSASFTIPLEYINVNVNDGDTNDEAEKGEADNDEGDDAENDDDDDD